MPIGFFNRPEPTVIGEAIRVYEPPKKNPIPSNAEKVAELVSPLLRGLGKIVKAPVVLAESILNSKILAPIAVGVFIHYVAPILLTVIGGAALAAQPWLIPVLMTVFILAFVVKNGPYHLHFNDKDLLWHLNPKNVGKPEWNSNVKQIANWIKDDFSFELGQIKRMYYALFAKEGKAFSFIGNDEKIALGIIPGFYLTASDLKKKGFTHVLSVNSPDERYNIGLNIPNTPEDYMAEGITSAEIDKEDHIPLTPKELEDAAYYIHNVTSKGGKVYVHCKAGQGRSAMAVAAYFMKYHDMSPVRVSEHVVKFRKNSTLNDSKPAIIGLGLESGLTGTKYDALQEFRLALDKEKEEDPYITEARKRQEKQNGVTTSISDETASFNILRDPTFEDKPPESLQPAPVVDPLPDMPTETAANKVLCQIFFKKHTEDQRILSLISDQRDANLYLWEQFKIAKLEADKAWR